MFKEFMEPVAFLAEGAFEIAGLIISEGERVDGAENGKAY
jgi:hypothetical protein